MASAVFRASAIFAAANGGDGRSNQSQTTTHCRLRQSLDKDDDRSRVVGVPLLRKLISRVDFQSWSKTEQIERNCRSLLWGAKKGACRRREANGSGACARALNWMATRILTEIISSPSSPHRSGRPANECGGERVAQVRAGRRRRRRRSSGRVVGRAGEREHQLDGPRRTGGGGG